MRDEKSVKEGEGPLKAAWINLLAEKLEIAKLSYAAAKRIQHKSRI